MWQKSWFRWSVRVLALVLLAAFAVTFALRWQGEKALRQARKDFVEKVGPLELRAYQAKAVPEQENGAVWLVAGAEAAVVFPSERPGLRSLADTPSERWAPEQAAVAQRLLQRNAPALALLRRCLALKACNLWEAEPGTATYRLDLLRAAQLLAADGRDALRQGDTDRFFADAETLRLLASAQERQPELIDLLLGSYAERRCLSVIREAADLPSLRPGDVDRLSALLPTADLLAALRRTAGYEGAAMMMRIANGTEAEHLGIQLGLVGHLENWIRGDAESARALRGWIAWSKSLGTPYARHGTGPAVQDSASDNPYVFDTQGRIPGRLQAVLALRQMTALGLEVRKAGLERGAYPENLSAFPGAGSPDPFTGKPLAYTLHPDGSALLAIPGGDALYDKLSNGKIPTIGATWTLPPVRVGGRDAKR